MRTLALIALSFGLLGTAVHAEPARPAAGKQAAPALGLPVGTLAPEFLATTMEGRTVAFTEDVLSDTDWTILITYRGGWCPYCNTHLHDVLSINDQIKARHAQLVAISVDLPDKALETVEQQALPFEVLSDASAQMFHTYNIANHIPDETYEKYRDQYHFDIEQWSGQAHHDVTHPAVIIIDPAGIIRFFHVNADYKLRMTNDQILKALATAQAQAATKTM